MRISLIQPLVTDDFKTNLQTIQSMLEQAIENKPDLIALCELFNTPFINDRILDHADEWSAWMDLFSSFSRHHHVWIIAGTLPRKSGSSLYNSCAIFNDQGELIEIADKTHLLEVHTPKHIYRESDVFCAGDHLCKVETPWGKLAILICFDLRFPEAARSLCEDCFMLVAPCGFNAAVGAKHWEPLIRTRAMENEVFVCAINPAAHDYGSYSSFGHTLAVSPDGVILGQLGGEPGILMMEIDEKQVEQIRSRSPFWSLRRPELCSPSLTLCNPDDKHTK